MRLLPTRPLPLQPPQPGYTWQPHIFKGRSPTLLTSSSFLTGCLDRFQFSEGDRFYPNSKPKPENLPEICDPPQIPPDYCSLGKKGFAVRLEAGGDRFRNSSKNPVTLANGFRFGRASLC